MPQRAWACVIVICAKRAAAAAAAYCMQIIDIIIARKTVK